jgi:D-alanyl-D-alanine dipeptidase
MNLPEQFCYLHDVDPSIKYDIKYASANNLIGRPIIGYQQNVCIVTNALGKALAGLQAELISENLELFVFETYRPTQAGADMLQWALDSEQIGNKKDYYPNIEKSDLYRLGYLIEYSAHSRGSTVDVTLVDSRSGQSLDMGTRFDFMDVLSQPNNESIGEIAFAHRQMLQTLMIKHGFLEIDTECWHFTLQDEPFPETCFNFPIA